MSPSIPPRPGVDNFFSVKGQIVNILHFEGQIVTMAIVQRCLYSVKAATDKMEMNELGRFPYNFICRDRWRARFGPQAAVC